MRDVTQLMEPSIDQTAQDENEAKEVTNEEYDEDETKKVTSDEEEDEDVAQQVTIREDERQLKDGFHFVQH